MSVSKIYYIKKDKKIAFRPSSDNLHEVWRPHKLLDTQGIERISRFLFILLLIIAQT